MKYDKAKPGGRPSASQWNGFLEMHREYNLNGAVNDPVPPVLQASTIVDCLCDADIEPFTPVRLIDIQDPNQMLEGSPSYACEDISTQSNFAGNWGFTLAEGLTGGRAGRVVVGGMAIVKVTIDDLVSTDTTGGYDSLWYNVPDGSMANFSIGPVGHFKLLSTYVPEDMSAVYTTEGDSAWILIDLSQKPGSVEVDVQSTISAATGPSTARALTSANAKVMQSTDNTTSTALELEASDLEITVYNPSASDVEAGVHTAIWSQVYNCFVIVQGGGGTGAMFPVSLEKVGGEYGTATTRTSWTYHVRYFNGSPDIIQANMDITAGAEAYKRPTLGRLTPATSGIAAYDFNGDLTILQCNEVIEVSVC